MMKAHRPVLVILIPGRAHKRKILIACAFVLLFFVLGVVMHSMITVISPEDMTRTAMGETCVRIKIYEKKHGHLPPSLTVLPERHGYINKITDAWGAPFMYKINDPTGHASLLSYGADGAEGGSGDNADISMLYKCCGDFQ